MRIIETVERIVEEENLCLNCLGRLFAGLLSGLTNEERGRALLIVLSMSLLAEQLRGKDGKKRDLLRKIVKKYRLTPLVSFLSERGELPEKRGIIKVCQVCRGIFDKIDEICVDVVKKLRRYDYETFMVGVSVPVEIEVRDDEIKSKYGLGFSESIRNEISREIGKRLRDATGKTFSRMPEVTITINPYSREIKIRSKAVIYEGIIELRREIKVFSSICLNCQGKGCEKCSYTGKVPGDDVEYILGKELLKRTEGRKWHFSIRKLSKKKFKFRFRVEQPKKRRISIEDIKLNKYPSFKVISIASVGA